MPGPSGPAFSMVHIQGINNLEATKYTLDHIFEQGVETDLIKKWIDEHPDYQDLLA